MRKLKRRQSKVTKNKFKERYDNDFEFRSKIQERARERYRNSDKCKHLWIKDITKDKAGFTVTKVPQSMDMLKEVMKHCWGVDSKMNLDKIFACNDSILELPEYYIKGTAPRSVVMQLRTHEKKHRMYMYVGTSRPDREDKVKGKYSRNQEIPFFMVVTARGLKDMAHYRMCQKAEEPTRKFFTQLKRALQEIEPALAAQLVPLCEFRGGICTEFNSCKPKK